MIILNKLYDFLGNLQVWHWLIVGYLILIIILQIIIMIVMIIVIWCFKCKDVWYRLIEYIIVLRINILGYG